MFESYRGIFANLSIIIISMKVKKKKKKENDLEVFAIDD